MKVFIDCETTSTDLQWVADEIKVEPPGNYKKPESIQKWMDENADRVRAEQIERTAVDTSLAQIICIGYAVDNGPVRIATGYESDILGELFGALSALHHVELVGHNIISFDIPLIYHRAIINGIRPHAAFHMHYKPWDGRCFDTMTEWAGSRDRISLDRLCKLLGFEGKGEIDGSMVPALFRAGEIELIEKYCADDVEKVRKIYRRLTNS